MDHVMMLDDQIAEYHRLWHTPGADRLRLAAAIRADIEAQRPKADDMAERAGRLLRAIGDMTDLEMSGDPKEVARAIRERAGIDMLPKARGPSRH